MEIKELKVIRTEKGLWNVKPVYIVEYGGKEQKVSMFDFQEDRTVPNKIRCIVNDNGTISQDFKNLLDEFYEIGKTYLFKIKERRGGSLKYYELEDKRLKGDTLVLNLPFANSSDKLEVGSIIECRITGFADKKPYLILVNANPSLIDFYNKKKVFGSNESFHAWLECVFAEEYLNEATRLYEKEDGRWICLFSKEMEKNIYSLLLSKQDNKEKLLTDLCSGWLNTIEHSPFMVKLSSKEKQEYSSWLTYSIEVCEDFKDALLLPDKEEKVTEIVSTLDPNYYQYRVERKLRFLSCIFSLNPEILRKNIEPLLKQIGYIGEVESVVESKYISIKSLLLMSFHIVADKWMDRSSIPNEAIKEIKLGILSLCYLIKIMLRRKEPSVVIYASNLYLLLSLCMDNDKEKLQTLKNAYKCLFSDISSVFHFNWESLGSIVKTGLYLFGRDNISVKAESSLNYDKHSSYCKLSAEEIILSPCNYQGELANFKVWDRLNARVCYNKSLFKLDTEGNFLSIRNAWKDVNNTFSSSVEKVEHRKPVGLMDEEEVEIYVTKIADNKEFGICKVVGYKETGLIPFKDMFFYPRPDLTIEDFIGTDGSPIIFPACCKNSSGSINFTSESYKVDYARDMLKEGDEVECSVLKRNQYDYYVCVTSRGFFLYVMTDGIELKFGALIKVEIVKINQKGNAQAHLKEVIDEKGSPDGKKVYVTYLKEFNQWYYGEEMTLKKWEEQVDEELVSESHSISRRATTGEMLNVACILAKLSELEKNPRKRYGYLVISKMLAHLIGNERYEELLDLRMKFVEILYNFSLNTRMQESDMTDFKSAIEERPLVSSEAKEMQNILSILDKIRNRTKNQELDKILLDYLEDLCPVEKELARLVLSGNLLSNFQNPELQDKVLDEIGKVLRIDIVKPKKVHIGEEGQRQEFKTSLVFPPNNGGNEDLEQQSENILRVILAMMNAKGGILYIGVNDDGDVVGLYDDLHYFSGPVIAYNETKAKDKFEGYFSNMLSKSIGAENASKFNYEFENREGYIIFKIEIPVLYVDDNNLYRVGNTVQEEN